MLTLVEQEVKQGQRQTDSMCFNNNKSLFIVYAGGVRLRE